MDLFRVLLQGYINRALGSRALPSPQISPHPITPAFAISSRLDRTTPRNPKPCFPGHRRRRRQRRQSSCREPGGLQLQILFVVVLLLLSVVVVVVLLLLHYHNYFYYYYYYTTTYYYYYYYFSFPTFDPPGCKPKVLCPEP